MKEKVNNAKQGEAVLLNPLDVAIVDSSEVRLDQLIDMNKQRHSEKNMKEVLVNNLVVD